MAPKLHRTIESFLLVEHILALPSPITGGITGGPLVRNRECLASFIKGNSLKVMLGEVGFYDRLLVVSEEIIDDESPRIFHPGVSGIIVSNESGEVIVEDFLYGV